MFLELVPLLSPRYYSISSAPEAAPGECSITVGVVKGPALSGKGEFRGTCSNYLAGLSPGEQFRAVVRKPAVDFRLPTDPQTPIIMVGPGTGIAPFRAFLQRLDGLKAGGEVIGDAMLFYGCRHPDRDYLYREEMQDYARRGIAEVHAAFSRTDGERSYVQDLIRRESARVWDMIERGARIYVCGDGARMEHDVRRTLAEICAERRGSSGAEAEAWMESMIAEGRYLLDVWVG